MGKVEERFNQRRQKRAQHDQLIEISRMAEAIAKVAHEVNRGYCEAMGDNSQPPWEEAPQWQQESAVRGVLFHMNNQDAGADASHNSWLAEKEQGGWVYGKEKDPEKKTHPCMVPFDELPREQQAKDYLFKSVVHAMLNGGYHGK